MTILNAIAQRKILEILDTLDGKGDEQIELEKDLLLNTMDRVADVIRNSGLPELKTELIVNRFETELESEYFNKLQKEVYDSVTYYRDILNKLGSEVNQTIDVISEYLDSAAKIMGKQQQELTNLKGLVLTKLNNNSILGESNLTIETLKEENLTTSNVTITPAGQVLLPLSANRKLNPNIKDITFKVISPLAAEKEISFLSNLSGKQNEKAILPGFFEGKLYGRLDVPNDVRLLTNPQQMLDDRNDTKWECEFVSDNSLSASFQILISVTFSSNQIMNYIGIDSSAVSRAFYVDDSGAKIFLSGNLGEFFSEFNGKELFIELTENASRQIEYHLDTIIKNEYKTHTYNTMETLARHMPDLYNARFPAIKIVPVREVEDQTRPEELSTELRKDKYRYAITMDNLRLQRNTYQMTGVLETIDLESAGEIYGVELTTNTWVPSASIEWFKYSLSFDSGKTWNRIRPVNETGTRFNTNLPVRLQLQDTEGSFGTEILNLRSTKVRLRIELATNDTLISPIVYNFRMRIKER